MSVISDEYSNMEVLSNSEFLDDFPVFTNISGDDDLYDERLGLSQMHVHEFVEISIVVEGEGIHLSLD